MHFYTATTLEGKARGMR